MRGSPASTRGCIFVREFQMCSDVVGHHHQRCKNYCTRFFFNNGAAALRQSARAERCARGGAPQPPPLPLPHLLRSRCSTTRSSSSRAPVATLASAAWATGASRRARRAGARPGGDGRACRGGEAPPAQTKKTNGRNFGRRASAHRRGAALPCGRPLCAMASAVASEGASDDADARTCRVHHPCPRRNEDMELDSVRPLPRAHSRARASERLISEVCPEAHRRARRWR